MIIREPDPLNYELRGNYQNNPLIRDTDPYCGLLLFS